MDDHSQMCEDCVEREARLSEWERDFIDSIIDRLGDDLSLTPKQIERLNEIWEKATAKG